MAMCEKYALIVGDWLALQFVTWLMDDNVVGNY